MYIRCVLQNDFNFLSHVYTEDQPEIHDLTILVRDWIDQFELNHDRKLSVLCHS